MSHVQVTSPGPWSTNQHGIQAAALLGGAPPQPAACGGLCHTCHLRFAAGEDKDTEGVPLLALPWVTVTITKHLRSADVVPPSSWTVCPVPGAARPGFWHHRPSYEPLASEVRGPEAETTEDGARPEGAVHSGPGQVVPQNCWLRGSTAHTHPPGRGEDSHGK